MSTSALEQYVQKLHEYAAHGDAAMVAACVKGMPDIDVKNEQGWTALMFAARNGHAAVVKILMDGGCDTSAINSSGQTSLDIAKFWNHHDVVKLLAPQPEDGSTSLPTASQPAPGRGANFFAGSVLDRADYHRKDKQWLADVKKLWKTKYLLFSQLSPAVIAKPDLSTANKKEQYRLYTATYQDIKEYLETDPVLVFIGMERRFKETGENVTGIPPVLSKTDGDSDIAWLALDATKLLEPEGKLKELNAHAELLPLYPGFIHIQPKDAAVLGQARSLLAWHDRYKFCPTCGSGTHVEEAGYKRVCNNEECRSQQGIHNTSYPRVDPTVIMAVVYPDHKRLLLGRARTFPRGMWSCLAGYAEPGVHNTCYPRVDPTAIMAVISPDEKSLLLGRGKKFRGNMWSCLAGFMEPGESIEDTVRREVFEEAGVHVGRVEYHSSQPWPMPSSLMIGCLAYATSTDIKVDKNELEQANWYSREEILMMLTRRHPQGLFCPPEQAIAHQLIRAWVNRTSSL